MEFLSANDKKPTDNIVIEVSAEYFKLDLKRSIDYNFNWPVYVMIRSVSGCKIEFGRKQYLETLLVFHLKPVSYIV